MRDEINEPLGQSTPPRPQGGGTARAMGFFVVCALAAGVTAGVWTYRHSRTHVAPQVAVIEPKPAAPAPVSPPTPPPIEAAEGGVSAFQSAEQVEKRSGVKVTRNGGGGPPGALIIDVPQALGVRLAEAPDPRLVESGKYGPLPKIGADGARPADVYARPIVESVKLRGAPKIAIVVGGLGLNTAASQAAIGQLPSAVSLGFAPYGQDLAALAAQARNSGHEILLQAPMEGFGGASSPHMLSDAASEAENHDALGWLMSRFPGFIGVENYLGGKFMADSKALGPVLAEIGSRGLLFLDDGSSPRSLAASLAPGMNLRAARADVVIDANPSPEAIEAALARLETLARQQDGAVGVATALPGSIDHIARWASALESRGIALKPVSALITRASMHSAGATP